MCDALFANDHVGDVRFTFTLLHANDYCHSGYRHGAVTGSGLRLCFS